MQSVDETSWMCEYQPRSQLCGPHGSSIHDACFCVCVHVFLFFLLPLPLFWALEVNYYSHRCVHAAQCTTKLLFQVCSTSGRDIQQTTPLDKGQAQSSRLNRHCGLFLLASSRLRDFPTVVTALTRAYQGCQAQPEPPGTPHGASSSQPPLPLAQCTFNPH